MTAATPGQADRILPAYDAVGERELSEAVHQALGFASVCWEPMDCTGVFESDRAAQAADELTGIIGQYAAAIAAQERPAPGEFERAFAVLAAERNQYRIALERIADNGVKGISASPQIARRALSQHPQPEPQQLLAYEEDAEADEASPQTQEGV